MIDPWLILDDLRERALERTEAIERTNTPDLREIRRLERAAIVARYRSGETVSEIARDIGVTSQAIRVRLRREGVDLRYRTA